MANETSEKMLSSRDIAEILQVNPKSVERWARRGEFPAGIVCGRLRRWPRSLLERWIAARVAGQP